MQDSFFKRGFTLIEILVVLAIIGILTGVLYLNFSEARNESRNKVLQSEMKEVQLALEVYRAQYGRYPAAPASCDTVSGATTTSNSATCTGAGVPYISGLVPDFIADLPDPNISGNSGCSFTYAVGSTDGDWYKLTGTNCHYTSSSTSGVTQNNELARCPTSCSTCAGSTLNAAYVATAPFNEAYAIYSVGGQCE